jgi:hypothetical protein
VIAALLMLTAVPATAAIEAERAFALDARRIGQWSAFRTWSTDDAVMFVPQPINAHEFLKDRKDPEQAIDWWPTASWMACDGSLAVNTGGWQRSDGTTGYFSTIWQRQPDGSWKWIVDSGDRTTTTRRRPRKVRPVVPNCHWNTFKNTLDFEDAGVKPQANGDANDGSIYWHWTVGADWSRHFVVGIRKGHGFKTVIDDRIAAPAQ